MDDPKPLGITRFRVSRLSYENRVRLTEKTKGEVLPRRGCGCVRGYSAGYRAPYCGDAGECGCCGEREDVIRPFSDFPPVCADCLHGTKLTVRGEPKKSGPLKKLPVPKKRMP